MMKANEVRKLSSADLEKKLTELKKDLFQLRLQHATNQLENPVLRLQLATNQLDNTNKINEVKHDIARINTVIREKQIAEKA
jgi:large subunit ribosomal protein L29